MKAQDINSILGINESFQMPGRVMELLLSDEAETVLRKFVEMGEALDHDWFTGYFEEEHANKSKMAQDFTPPEVCDLLAHVVGRADTIADVCAGTGGLTIGMWRSCPGARYICYEYSSRAIPLLLFNLAVRNIDAFVCRCDVLTGEEFEYYHVIPGEQFGQVARLDSWTDIKVQAAVSNPPYSMKYDPQKDDRFPQYRGMLPSNFADFVFVAFALELLDDDGAAGFILPHGVLFRGNKEKLFREALIKQNLIDSIIGLPDKLFINTDIPTCIVGVRKDRARSDILFIDASDEAEKRGKKNVLRDEDIRKICRAVDERKDIERFASVITTAQIAENDTNLNIPRYVDTFVPEPVPDLCKTVETLAALEREEVKAQIELLEMIRQLYGTTPEADAELKKAQQNYKQIICQTDELWVQEVMKI